jgi:hypothetical protein
LKQSIPSLIEGGEARWVGDDVDLGSMEHALYGQGRDPNYEKLSVGIISDYKGLGATSPDRLAGPQWTWDVRDRDPSGTQGSIDARAVEFYGDVSSPLHRWSPKPRGGGPKAVLRPGLFHYEIYELALDHPELRALWEAFAEPLATAWKQNLQAWAEIVDGARTDQGLRAVAAPLAGQGRASRQLGELDALRWVSPELLHRSIFPDAGVFHPEGLAQTVNGWIPIIVPDPWEFLPEGRAQTVSDQIPTEAGVAESDFSELAEALRQSAIACRVPPIDAFIETSRSIVSPTGDDYTSDMQGNGWWDSITQVARARRLVGVPDQIRNISWYDNKLLFRISEHQTLSVRPYDALHEYLADTIHVKGLRPQMRRTYTGLTHTVVPTSGEFDPTRALATALYSDHTLIAKINAFLQRMSLEYSINIRSSVNTFFPITMHAIYLQDSRNGVQIGIQDVGFGVGQAIPVLAELSKNNGGLLLLEQPELHLHPKAQAELGQLLAEAVQARGSLQLVAETHSEHVVLRLMRLVREGKLPHDLVQILYVNQNDEGKSDVTELPLDKDGEFTVDWPNGFFDERLNEL